MAGRTGGCCRRRNQPAEARWPRSPDSLAGVPRSAGRHVRASPGKTRGRQRRRLLPHRLANPLPGLGGCGEGLELARTPPDFHFAPAGPAKSAQRGVEVIIRGDGLASGQLEMVEIEQAILRHGEPRYRTGWASRNIGHAGRRIATQTPVRTRLCFPTIVREKRAGSTRKIAYSAARGRTIAGVITLGRTLLRFDRFISMKFELTLTRRVCRFISS